MKNKPVIITGCSSGIGKDAALTLHKLGYKVIATVRNSKDIPFYANKGIDCYQLDLANADSIKHAVKQITDKHPSLYAVVHNGAYGQPGALIDVSREALIKQFQTNVFGTHDLTNMLLPYLISSDSARIVYISSVLGFAAAPLRGAYNASKFALEGIASTLRLELVNTNVKISIIQPGPIESSFRKNALLAFNANIDVKNSMYEELYKTTLQKLSSKVSTSKWTLPASKVTSSIIHALGSNPKLYYRITTPTKVIALLQKILPARAIDAIMKNQ